VNPRCRETLAQAYLLLDGEPVPEAERREVQAHLEACAPCYERYGIEQEVKALIARLHGCTTCPEQLRVRIVQLLHFEH
jgi:mycothiol system anti-sigma-R factor